jgi:hypothetical protein
MSKLLTYTRASHGYVRSHVRLLILSVCTIHFIPTLNVFEQI